MGSTKGVSTECGQITSYKTRVKSIQHGETCKVAKHTNAQMGAFTAGGLGEFDTIYETGLESDHVLARVLGTAAEVCTGPTDSSSRLLSTG